MATAKDYGLGSFTFPRGWFMVADAEQLADRPLSVRFFGQDLVLYRGESGKPYMVSAYCPHMRTHIGKSTASFMAQRGDQVQGESIRCPYHAWRFGPDGKCNHIPYSDSIPAGAKLEAFPVVERYNAIFHWHDPEGQEPDYPLPDIPEWDDPQYVRWHFDDLGPIGIHQLEVIDNICDIQHLHPVHASHQSYFENVISGHRIWQLMGGKHEMLGVDADITEFNTFYTGPGILISKFFGDMASMMFICHTPIDDGSIHAWHATLTRIAERMPTDEDVAAARAYQKLSRDGLAQDFEIWANKESCLRPMQMPRDGNFLKVRTWYKQFYNGRADIADILERCEGRYVIPGMPDAAGGNARAEIISAPDLIGRL